MQLTPEQMEKFKETAYNIPDEVPNCPCCGSKAKLAILDGGDSKFSQIRYMVYCTCCHLQTMQYVGPENAVRVWSTRVNNNDTLDSVEAIDKTAALMGKTRQQLIDYYTYLSPEYGAKLSRIVGE